MTENYLTYLTLWLNFCSSADFTLYTVKCVCFIFTNKCWCDFGWHIQSFQKLIFCSFLFVLKGALFGKVRIHNPPSTLPSIWAILPTMQQQIYTHLQSTACFRMVLTFKCNFKYDSGLPEWYLPVGWSGSSFRTSFSLSFPPLASWVCCVIQLLHVSKGSSARWHFLIKVAYTHLDPVLYWFFPQNKCAPRKNSLSPKKKSNVLTFTSLISTLHAHRRQPPHQRPTRTQARTDTHSLLTHLILNYHV